MNRSKDGVIILCEAGWRNVRELSLKLAAENIRAFVVIKGDPGREVKQMISELENIRNIFVPRIFFRVYLPIVVLELILFKKARLCLWTHQRTSRELAPLLAIFGIRIFRLVEQDWSYHLENEAGHTISYDDAVAEIVNK